MFTKSALAATLSLAFVATNAQATTLVVNLTNVPEYTYKQGNDWFLKTQGVTFTGAGPVSVGGGSLFIFDAANYDEGTGAFTLEDLGFTAHSVSFDLTRIRTSTFCNLFVPQTCIDANKIGATAYDTLGNLIGDFVTTDFSASVSFSSAAGIGKIVWTGSNAFDGRNPSPFWGQGSRLSNLVLNSAVPEPATWSMMIAGFGMIGGAARYRRRTQRVTYA